MRVGLKYVQRWSGKELLKKQNDSLEKRWKEVKEKVMQIFGVEDSRQRKQ